MISPLNTLLSIRPYIAITWVFWSCALIFTLVSYNPSNTFIGFRARKNLIFSFPQGWGFFTKNPKDAIVESWELNEGTLTLQTINNFSASNAFGLSRKARFIGYELGKITEYIPKEAYETKIGNLYGSYPQKATPVYLPFKLHFFPANKEFVIYQHKLVPYTWMNQDQEKYKPYIQARIKIVYSPKSKRNLKKYFEKNR